MAGELSDELTCRGEPPSCASSASSPPLGDSARLPAPRTFNLQGGVDCDGRHCSTAPG